ncbi:MULTISPECIES: hypothetical protein [unclassified Streptomyces]|nr:hypothetical protein [Streptomyces sp. BK340]
MDRTREPVRAQLVAARRAEGRTVPVEPDVLRGSLGGLVLPGPERP